MPRLTIDIPDAAVPRVLAALGVDTAAEAKQAVIAWLREQVRWHEQKQAEAEALAAVNPANADDIAG